jgi:sigma-B regulation protein RsbU (phosphoserine phosphatase)
LPDLIKALNETVFKNAKGEKHITVFLARINHLTKEINFVNAGHNPPILYHNDEFALLEAGTTGLGMFDKLPFLREGTVKFLTGAHLFCYTDGVTELEDAEGNFFGIELFKKFIALHCLNYDVKTFHEMLLGALNDFRKEAAFNDDVTLLTIKSV